MGANLNQKAALTLIADWCKWFVTIETVSIGAIATLLKPSDNSVVILPVALLFSVTMISFIVSVALAAFALTSLPEAMTDIDPDANNDPHGKVWSRRVDCLRFEMPLWRVIVLQLYLFIFGLMTFTAGVIWMACAQH